MIGGRGGEAEGRGAHAPSSRAGPGRVNRGARAWGW
jgi:hypothetical protein